MYRGSSVQPDPRVDKKCSFLSQNPDYNTNGVRWRPCPPGNFCLFPSSEPKKCPPGFFCPANTTQPFYCCGGFYCPNPGEIKLCPSGQFCRPGSVKGEGCFAFASCPPGTESPTRVGVIGFFIALAILVWYGFHQKAKRDAKQRMKYKALAQELEKKRLMGQSKSQEGQQMAPVSQTFNIRCEDLGRRLQDGKWIMKGVSGTLWAGRTLAIMGPSGAGKSTFISLLTNKAPRTTGKVFINDHEEELSKYKKLIGYVPQEDIMLRELTVRKIITHSALMRLPTSMTEKEKKEKAIEVIQFLGLDGVMDQCIGNEEERGISGGQRKRVNIGMELVTDPSVLFLDEPTSGLDSSTAFEVCKILKRIAQMRMITIAAVIHSPSPAAFNQFDDVLLLGKGGQVCYFGPRDQCLQYFSNLGFVCPEGESHSDFFMNVISGHVPCSWDPDFTPPKLFTYWEKSMRGEPISASVAAHAGSEATLSNIPSAPEDGDKIGNAFRSLFWFFGETVQDIWEWFKDVMSELWESVVSVTHFVTRTSDPIRETPGFFFVFWLCLKRAVSQVLLSPVKFLVDLLLHLGSGAFISIASQQMDYLGRQPDEVCQVTPVFLRWACENPRDFLREVGLFMSLGVLFAGISVGTNTFGNERVVFWRDTSAGMPTLPYFLAKFVVDIPRIILAAFMFTLAFILQWNYRGTIFLIYAIVLLLYLSAFTMGYFLSTICKRESASLVGTAFALAWALVFSGVIPSLKEVMEPDSSFRYISFFWNFSSPRYAIEALYLTETIVRPWQELNDSNAPSYIEKGYRKDNLSTDMSSILGIAVVWAALAFLGLKLLHRDKQK